MVPTGLTPHVDPALELQSAAALGPLGGVGCPPGHPGPPEPGLPTDDAAPLTIVQPEEQRVVSPPGFVT